MSERELVQQALTHLSQPNAPLRVRQSVMAIVRREAGEPKVQTWTRTQSDGWTIEHREGVSRPRTQEPRHAFTSPIIHTIQWQHQDGVNTVIDRVIRF